MNHSLKYIAGILFAISCIFSAGSAFADSGFNCDPYNDWDYMYREEAFLCEEVCKAGVLCPEVQAYDYFFNDVDNPVPGGEKIIAECRTKCEETEKSCTDDACRASVTPQNIDCDEKFSDSDVYGMSSYCSNSCQQNIEMTSDCAMGCLREAFYREYGFKMDCSSICSRIYKRDYDDSDCASIPLKPEDNMSIFAILLGFLALFVSGMIVVMNHKKAENK